MCFPIGGSDREGHWGVGENLVSGIRQYPLACESGRREMRSLGHTWRSHDTRAREHLESPTISTPMHIMDY